MVIFLQAFINFDNAFQLDKSEFSIHKLIKFDLDLKKEGPITPIIKTAVEQYLLCNGTNALLYFDANKYSSDLKQKLEKTNLNVYAPLTNNRNSIIPSGYVIDQEDLSKYLPQLPDFSNFCPERGF